MEFTGVSKVWVTSDYFDPRSSKEFVEKGRVDALVGKFVYTNSDMSTVPDWTEVGNAMVTVVLFDDDVLLEQKVSSLRSEIKRVRAESQQKIDMLEEKLQSLLALPNLEK
jgi:hypothetical protein